MADHVIATGNIAVHSAQLTANTVETFEFTDGISTVEIVSDGTAIIFYTTDGTVPASPWSNCHIMPINTNPFNRIVPITTGKQVQMKSSGTPTVSVVKAT